MVLRKEKITQPATGERKIHEPLKQPKRKPAQLEEYSECQLKMDGGTCKHHCQKSYGKLAKPNTCFVHRSGIIPQVSEVSHYSDRRERPFTAEARSTPRTYHIPNCSSYRCATNPRVAQEASLLSCSATSAASLPLPSSEGREPNNAEHPVLGYQSHETG